MPFNVSTFTYGKSNALIKEFVQRFIDGLSASGWVQTSDTGQIDPSAIVLDAPANGATLGYAMFVLDDSGRVDDPIYLRAGFEWAGVGYNSAGSEYWGPQTVLSVGFATNGAGTLTGQSLSCGRVANGGGYPITFNTGIDIFAGGDGWATIFQGLNYGYYDTTFSVKQICGLVIHRIKDADGIVVPGKLYLAYPEPGRLAYHGNVVSAYAPYLASGSRDGNTTRMVGAYLTKSEVTISGSAVTPGVIGTASNSGTVEGIVQAQPAWMYYPQIAPFPGLVIVPSAVFAPGQVFTASVDGVNEYKYASLGAAAGGTSVGAMYAIDSFAGSTFCFAARVE